MLKGDTKAARINKELTLSHPFLFLFFLLFGIKIIKESSFP